MIFDAALEQRQTEGAERELQTEYGLQANQIPLAMLEQRAAATASAPANVGQNQAEIVPVVFPQSAAAFLGVDMPTVAVGESVYPVMTAPTSPRRQRSGKCGSDGHCRDLQCGSAVTKAHTTFFHL